MKKIGNLWSVALTTLIFISCQKSDEFTTGDVNTQTKKGGGGPVTSTTTYAGQATGLNATVWNTEGPTVTSNQTILAQTAPLPSTGGDFSASHGQANVNGVVSVDALYASTLGSGNSIFSQASATNLIVTAGGNTITASYVESNATATCGYAVHRNSRVDNLVINGQAIAVTGAPNQAVYLPNGGLVLVNEQSTSKKNSSSTASVSGLHIIIPNAADIKIATASAEIKCSR